MKSLLLDNYQRLRAARHGLKLDKILSREGREQLQFEVARVRDLSSPLYSWRGESEDNKSISQCKDKMGTKLFLLLMSKLIWENKQNIWALELPVGRLNFKKKRSGRTADIPTNLHMPYGCWVDAFLEVIAARHQSVFVMFCLRITSEKQNLLVLG